MSADSNTGVVIVGGSHAAAQLAHGLRRLGWTSPVCIVSDEPVLPYHRPPLSKDFLKGKKTFDQILLRPASMYEQSGIELLLGRRATSIDRDRKQLTLDDGRTLGYDKLVLTTGARPRRLPVTGGDLRGVSYVRTVADIENISAEVVAGGGAVVIGGGYIGLEAAASLRILQMDVTVVEAEPRILQRVTGVRMSDFFTRLHSEEGVDIRLNERVAAIHGSDRVSGVELASGAVVPASLVVIGIGIVPNVELAGDAGLAVDNGIVVDEYCRTGDPDIYAAGDCASFVHPLYDAFMRLESVQNAHDQATIVARAICGQPEAYCSVPWFWSDQFDVKLQIAGLSMGHDEVVERGDNRHGRSFSLCYLKDGQLLAVDAVNHPKDFAQSKKLIAERAVMDTAVLADGDVPLNVAVAGAAD